EAFDCVNSSTEIHATAARVTSLSRPVNDRSLLRRSPRSKRDQFSGSPNRAPPASTNTVLRPNQQLRGSVGTMSLPSYICPSRCSASSPLRRITFVFAEPRSPKISTTGNLFSLARRPSLEEVRRDSACFSTASTLPACGLAFFEFEAGRAFSFLVLNQAYAA